MNSKTWNDLVMPAPPENELWEVFHENSKITPYSNGLSEEEIRDRMLAMEECLLYDQYPVVPLPRVSALLPLSLEQAIIHRVSAKSLRPRTLRLEELEAILHYAYGVTRSNEGTTFPRSFRAAPSAGALYPLEIYLFSRHLEGQPAGLYHYNPVRNELRLLQPGDLSPQLSNGLVSFQSNLAQDAALIVFLTAIFERSTFKYGARGYRFVLLEAGHVAQNINLVATALGLGSINLGGYYDRRVDDLLNLDGVTHSTVYMIAIGENTGAQNNGGIL